MADTKVTVTTPIASILGIVFIVLKLVGTINWSWWWVLSPFWIPFVFWFVIFLFALILGIIAGTL